MQVNRRQRGFSLVEVATSIGVISFALVALIGVFPLGLENTRLCIADTRATQLVKMVSVTLESEDFAKSSCFNPDTGNSSTLDYNTLEVSSNGGANVKLYASYDVRELPRLVRATTEPLQAIYRVELRFRRQYFTSLAVPNSTPRVVGTNVDVQVFGIKDKKPFAENWIYIPNYPHQSRLTQQ